MDTYNLQTKGYENDPYKAPVFYSQIDPCDLENFKCVPSKDYMAKIVDYDPDTKYYWVTEFLEKDYAHDDRGRSHILINVSRLEQGDLIQARLGGNNRYYKVEVKTNEYIDLTPLTKKDCRHIAYKRFKKQ